MMFNPYNFKIDKDQANFRSMGTKAGNFMIDDKTITNFYQFVASDESAQFCFLEVKSEYFKLFWDFDVKEQFIDLFKDINFEEFWDYIIETILKVLKKYIKEDTKEIFNYIYSDRNDLKNRIHVYFPNIKIDCDSALTLALIFKNELKNDKKYKINNYDEIINEMVDLSIFTYNGLKLLFQKKKDQTGFYKINLKKSTYPIPNDPIKQLAISSIRTNETKINFTTIKKKNSENSLLDDKKNELCNEIENAKKNKTNLLQNIKACGEEMDVSHLKLTIEIEL